MPQVNRVAMLSLHTSPLEQPGSGDAGGMNVYVRSVAVQMAKMGVQVDIFTRASAPDQPPAVEIAPGATVRHITAGPRRRLPKEVLPGLAEELAEGISAAARGLQEHGRYDVLHSHYWVSGIAGLALARQWDVPLVHTMHTMARVKNVQLQPGERAEPQVRIQGEQDIVDSAARLIANTTTEASELATWYGASESAIDVVAPGVDLEVFSPAGRALAKPLHGIRREEFHVVFAGRIQRMKGPQVLVEAAAKLRTARPDIPLRISILGAPSGSEVLDLEAAVASLALEGTVQLRPPIAAGGLAGWFRSADVVAVPSYSESFGLVALEAQACGTPVIAADVGGLPKAVSSGRTGILVQGHDPARWAAELETLYDHQSWRAELGRSAAVHARAFGWQRTAMLTTQGYRRAADQASAQSVRN
ncbi:D-inositol-3-phosphate glycosyltransferase [Arthrobacter sp. Helios]|uniref:D-inositol-3-phosphate glycosyltransferase n=1 Tax=Arthrobacter sp. Helios TaxID=2828862 RepID=UPI002047421F|nr:D-inositol-3-phosphate glycosyltransferase [Arthrobacter sp. Helios]UPO76589.1 D-inositol-3-phosphate glycosyltransferase [Arthrobacter sp. Helios]